MRRAPEATERGESGGRRGRKDAVTPRRSKTPLYLIGAAMGGVFGDIGTSPLYTLKVCLGLAGSKGGLDDVLGVCSLIFWVLVVVVCVKYVTFIMRVDHEGEGGILALLALASPPRPFGTTIKTGVLTLIVVVGGSMMIGDGVITPAISVISAVEGIGIVSQAFEPYVVAISLAVIIALFALQRSGTESVGKLFGPVMLLWFAA